MHYVKAKQPRGPNHEMEKAREEGTARTTVVDVAVTVEVVMDRAVSETRRTRTR